MSITATEVNHAEQVLKNLKAKIDLVKGGELDKKSPSERENFFFCEKQYFMLSGKLENLALEEIARKIAGHEAEFNKGINNLKNIIAGIHDGLAFLGILDGIVSILARVAPMLA